MNSKGTTDCDLTNGDGQKMDSKEGKDNIILLCGERSEMWEGPDLLTWFSNQKAKTSVKWVT